METFAAPGTEGYAVDGEFSYTSYLGKRSVKHFR